jgi:hypothetical protein
MQEQGRLIDQEEKLRNEVHVTGKRYRAQESTRDEYLLALKRFADLILRGTPPGSLLFRIVEEEAEAGYAGFSRRI